MAKKIRTVLTLQLPAGAATPAPPVGTALGPHGINIVEFTKSYNEKTPGQARPDHPGPDHDLRGSLVHVHPQDAARRRPPPQGGRRREGLGPGPKRETVGRVSRDQVREIAADQDGRPQRERPRGGREGQVEGTAPLDGHRGRRLGSPTHARRATHAEPRTPRERGGRSAGRQERNRDMAHGKKYLEAAKLVDRERVYSPDEAAQLVKDTTFVGVRRHRRGPPPARRRSPPRRPDGPRHGRPPARHRQRRPRRRLRPGRQGPGGAPGRRRRGRRRGPRRRRSRPAGSTSTSRSRRPTRWAWSAGSARSSAGAA